MQPAVAANGRPLSRWYLFVKAYDPNEPRDTAGKWTAGTAAPAHAAAGFQRKNATTWEDGPYEIKRHADKGEYSLRHQGKELGRWSGTAGRTQAASMAAAHRTAQSGTAAPPTPVAPPAAGNAASALSWQRKNATTWEANGYTIRRKAGAGTYTLTGPNGKVGDFPGRTGRADAAAAAQQHYGGAAAAQAPAANPPVASPAPSGGGRQQPFQNRGGGHWLAPDTSGGLYHVRQNKQAGTTELRHTPKGALQAVPIQSFPGSGPAELQAAFAAGKAHAAANATPPPAPSATAAAPGLTPPTGTTTAGNPHLDWQERTGARSKSWSSGPYSLSLADGWNGTVHVMAGGRMVKNSTLQDPQAALQEAAAWAADDAAKGTQYKTRTPTPQVPSPAAVAAKAAASPAASFSQAPTPKQTALQGTPTEVAYADTIRMRIMDGLQTVRARYIETETANGVPVAKITKGLKALDYDVDYLASEPRASFWVKRNRKGPEDVLRGVGGHYLDQNYNTDYEPNPAYRPPAGSAESEPELRQASLNGIRYKQGHEKLAEHDRFEYDAANPANPQAALDFVAERRAMLAHAASTVGMGLASAKKHAQRVKQVASFTAAVDAIEQAALAHIGGVRKAVESLGRAVSAAEAREAWTRLQAHIPANVRFPAFLAGMKVELEHADVTKRDLLATGKIALAHLRETPDYYTRLKRVEPQGE